MKKKQTVNDGLLSQIKKAECLLVSKYGFSVEFVQELNPRVLFEYLNICIEIQNEDIEQKIKEQEQKEKRLRFYIAESVRVALADILPRLLSKGKKPTIFKEFKKELNVTSNEKKEVNLEDEFKDFKAD